MNAKRAKKRTEKHIREKKKKEYRMVMTGIRDSVKFGITHFWWHPRTDDTARINYVIKRLQKLGYGVWEKEEHPDGRYKITW